MIIGAGGVGNVVAKKAAREKEVFSGILLASRTLSKCEKIAGETGVKHLRTARVDADNVQELIKLMEDFRPDLVINVALPYQDLSIMDACLETGAHYLDTANYEPVDEAKFEYKWQWAYKEKFEKAGLMALLGCGFDPGVTGIFTAYALKHHFDQIEFLDILDCNAGDHGKPFATNFNPEINIREITRKGRYWEQGRWKEVEPLSVHRPVVYPDIGPRESYLLYHEELESLTKNIPSLKRARFWMTFSPQYITYLRVLQDVGLTDIKPVHYNGMEIVPLQFLKALLPEPSELGKNYRGETSIGCQIKGIKDNAERTYYIWNNCRHEDAWKDAGAQAVSYTTGVPAMLGAKLMLEGTWMKPGVYNVEELDPDPFMEQMGPLGLPWQEQIDQPLAFDDYE